MKVLLLKVVLVLIVTVLLAVIGVQTHKKNTVFRQEEKDRRQKEYDDFERKRWNIISEPSAPYVQSS